MSETRHHIRSVSDLYAADEIEVLLLEEIRDLESPPAIYSRPEDIQDFEIGTYNLLIKFRAYRYYSRIYFVHKFIHTVAKTRKTIDKMLVPNIARYTRICWNSTD